jgi:hypothetical protein
MKRMLTMPVIALGGALFATLLAPSARAGCGDNPVQSPASIQPPSPYLRQAVNRPGNFLLVSDNDDRSDAPIVGLWKVTFLSKNNAGIDDGTVIDAGYVQWHADGTEIMNSIRPPATQNFCLGVWKKIGHLAYKLNHFALSFDLTGNRNGFVNIREEVTVDPREDKYKGTFTIDVFTNDGLKVSHLAGDLTGERITAD